MNFESAHNASFPIPSSLSQSVTEEEEAKGQIGWMFILQDL